MEEYERNGLTVKIETDNDPINPREEYDNVGTMICSHRNYKLGDEQFDSDDYDGWKDLEDHLVKERGAVVILPLGLYDHSGITMYVGNERDWDSGQVGFIFCTQEDIDREWDGDKEKAEKYLRSEVETYDQYLTGEVYGYTIEDQDGDDVGSCWGFFGLEYCKQAANDVADTYIKPFKRGSMGAKKASKYHG